MTNAPPATASSGSSINSVFSSILSGLESGIFSMVLSVLTVFLPKFINLGMDELTVIGNNFRLFLNAIGGGTPWGQALADMMTADWNELTEDGKQAAIDFAESVATVLETAELLPQGK
jgi:hypothetical protein